MIVSKIKGFDAILKKKKKQDQIIILNYGRGVKKAGLFLQRQSMKEVPVDKGPLRASAFTRATGSGKQIQVQVGYTAGYAIYVHENLDAAHGAAFNAKYRKEIKEGRMRSRGAKQKAKFLEDPFKDRSNRAQMRQIIANETKLS